MRACASALLVLAAVFPAGCGSDAADGRQALSGTVRLRGEPLDHGSIQFQPTAPEQKYATGAMIEHGKFSISREFGLTPGVYLVVISSQEIDKNAPPPGAVPGASPPPKMRELIPPEYGVRSKRTIEVKAGREPNHFDFDLK